MTIQKEVIHHIRMALMDEIKATDDYDRLEEMDPVNAETYREIRNDEINHQGRLLAIIMKKDSSQMEHMNAGLGGKE